MNYLSLFELRAARRGTWLIKKCLLLILPIAILLPTKSSFAVIETNNLVSMQMSEVKGNPTLRIVTEIPIGERYTIYESFNPDRLIIFLPQMNISAVSSLSIVNQSPVKTVNVSSHDLTGGRLCQIEIMLSEMGNYEVDFKDNEFLLTLLLKSDQVTSTAVVLDANETEPVQAPPAEQADNFKRISPGASAIAKEETTLARKVLNVDVGPQVVILKTDGFVDDYKYFSLSEPERLVVDVYGVKPGFKARSYPLQGDFSGTRVGVYGEKLRFVFDATDKLPNYSINSNGDSLVIRWGADSSFTTNPL